MIWHRHYSVTQFSTCDTPPRHVFLNGRSVEVHTHLYKNLTPRTLEMTIVGWLISYP